MGLLLISEAYNQRIMKNMHKWALFVHHKNMLSGVVQRCFLLTVDEKRIGERACLQNFKI